MNDARVDVRSDGGEVHLVLSGDIDLANADELQAQLVSGVANYATAVELDMTDVTYLDSSGLQIVYALTAQLQRLQIRLRIVAPWGTPARHALEVSGMASLTEIEPPPPH